MTAPVPRHGTVPRQVVLLIFVGCVLAPIAWVLLRSIKSLPDA